jgi:hypothetical protein
MTREDFLEKLPPEVRARFELARAAFLAGKKFTASGFSTTPPDILAAREATCRACPEWDAAALNASGRCRKCGCSTWAKLRMATESCPLGKWKSISFPPVTSPAEPLGA